MRSLSLAVAWATAVLFAAFPAERARADEAQAVSDAARGLADEAGRCLVVGVVRVAPGPGCVLDERVYAFGRAGRDGQAADERTLFEIGSVTKVFTGVLLAELCARGDVAETDSLTACLPGRALAPGVGAIRLRALATHTSGLPRLPGNLIVESWADPYASYRIEDLEAYLEDATPAGEAACEYSNLGMGLLGHVLAVRSGRPYGELLADRVLAPLGLSDTSIDLAPRDEPRLAPGHGTFGLQGRWHLPALAGAGGLCSSARDLLRFLAACLQPDASTPLGRALSSALEARVEAAPGLSVGLAWHLSALPGGDVVAWHNGATGGYASYVGLDLARRQGVVLLANASDPERVTEAGDALVRALR